MSDKDYADVQRKFDKLFDISCHRKLTDEERKEYFRLQQILVDSDSVKRFYALIASGDYRIGC